MFPKDIVVIDFETSNKELEKAEPLQIGAILLDKNTLEEKKNFVSYIVSNSTNENININGITLEKLTDAPTQKEVAKKFIEIFGKDFIFSGWVCEKDRALFRKMMITADINPSDFNFHILDIWPLAYVHLLKQNYSGSMGSEEMFQAFGLPARANHDALEDCRYAAEILKKLIL